MKTIFISLLFASAVVLASCGNESKKESEEIQAHEDSIRKDTSVNNSVNAANDFLNDTTVGDSVAKK